MHQIMSCLKQSFLLLVSLPILVPLLSALLVSLTPNKTTLATTTDIFGVKIEKNPPQSKLNELQVTNWRTWEGGPGITPWTFTGTETMYLLKGKVKVAVEGYDGSFEIGAGDLAVFPKGMKITWEVIEAVKKHWSVEN